MHPLRHIKAMVHDAVDATVELVREGNESAARTVRAVSAPVHGIGKAVAGVDAVRHVMTAGVLGSVKAVNRLVEFASDMALDMKHVGMAGPVSLPLALRSDVAGERAWLGDVALGVLNAAVGDYLGESGNALGMGMRVRLGQVYLDESSPPLAWEQGRAHLRPHLCVFIHGLGATEWSWSLGSSAYYGSPHISLSTEVAGALDASVVHIRYNTGCAIGENGQRLAALLERVCHGAGTTRLTLIGHSMGGLILRHACHQAQLQGLDWGKHVRDVAYLGSPHEGAPLAAFGTSLTDLFWRVDLPATRILSRILGGRSVGTKDLAAGMSMAMREQLPLGCRHHFIFGTIVQDAQATASRLVGDILVRPSSASGSALGTSALNKRVWHHGGLWHHHLQNHPAVAKALIASIQAS